MTEAPCILVVDDEPSVRAIARATLVRAGFTVLVAADGATALNQLREEGTAVDAVLLDVTMPGLSGLDTLKGIHAIRRGMPVVLTSGYSDRQASEGCNGEAVAGFLQKPFAPAALVSKINEALGAGAGK